MPEHNILFIFKKLFKWWQKTFWVSYDLGLKGDYAGPYTWLDTMGAKECGNSIAFFSKDYEEGFVDVIKTDIQKFVKLKEGDRIYLIYLESKTQKMKGIFLYGGRKRHSWEGYAVGINNMDEDFA